MVEFAWKEIKGRQFIEARDVLPPIRHRRDSFLLGEPQTHRNCTLSGRGAETYTPYLTTGGEFYQGLVDVTVREWEAYYAKGRQPLFVAYWDEQDTQEDSSYDLDRMMLLVRNLGIYTSRRRVERAWSLESQSVDAGWIQPGDDDHILTALRKWGVG